LTAISNDSRCNCPTIYPVQKVKCLGITIDTNLKWQDHIIDTIRKIRLLFYNASIKMAMELNINVSLFTIFSLYKKWSTKKLNY